MPLLWNNSRAFLCFCDVAPYLNAAPELLIDLQRGVVDDSGAGSGRLRRSRVGSFIAKIENVVFDLCGIWRRLRGVVECWVGRLVARWVKVNRGSYVSGLLTLVLDIVSLPGSSSFLGVSDDQLSNDLGMMRVSVLGLERLSFNIAVLPDAPSGLVRMMLVDHDVTQRSLTRMTGGPASHG